MGIVDVALGKCSFASSQLVPPGGDLGWVHIIGPSWLRASILGPLLSLSGPHWPSYIFPVSEAIRRSSTYYNRVLFETLCQKVRRSSLKA